MKEFANISVVSWCRILAVIIILLAARNVFTSVINWESLKGWEAYHISQSIAKGEGFSFPSTKRWLFDAVSDGRYHSTAWVDPLYTYCLAALIWLFGDNHQIAAAIFNLSLYIAIFVLTYRLTERLISPVAALLTVLLLTISNFTLVHSQMNNTSLASLFIILSIIALVNYYDEPSIQKAIRLGLVLGVTVLASPSAQLFIFVISFSIIYWGRKKLAASVTHSVVMFLISIVIILPWTIRNYIIFDEIVPVRSGLGQVAFVGVVAVAGTVVPEKLKSTIKPSWKAETLREAVFKARGKNLEALEKFQLEYAKELIPDTWQTMNEAQRDKWFLKEAEIFLVGNPLVSVQLSIAKIERFVRGMGHYGIGIIVLAIIGALANVKKPSVITIAFLVGTYVAPFAIVICYYDRYRAPIEPLLTLLATYAIYWIFTSSMISTRSQFNSETQQGGTEGK